MRYMLYDSSGDKISLSSEIEYLKNYINLQLLRFGDSVRFNLFVSGNPENYKIEPMLLIPFVENAFKHGTSVDDPMIEVAIVVDNEENSHNLMVSNYVGGDLINIYEGSGIWLFNVLRRLELFYPVNHHILLDELDVLYSVYF